MGSIQYVSIIIYCKALNLFYNKNSALWSVTLFSSTIYTSLILVHFSHRCIFRHSPFSDLPPRCLDSHPCFLFTGLVWVLRDLACKTFKSYFFKNPKQPEHQYLKLKSSVGFSQILSNLGKEHSYLSNKTKLIFNFETNNKKYNIDVVMSSKYVS